MSKNRDGEYHINDLEPENDEQKGTRSSYKETGNKAELTTESPDIRTLEDALDFYKPDLSTWEVYSHTVNSWPIASKYRDQDLHWRTNEDGQQVMEGHAIRKNEWIEKRLFQVKIQFRRKKPFDVSKFKKEILADLAEKTSPRTLKRVRAIKDPHLYALSINDIHLGRVVWHEVAGRDSDWKIVVGNFLAGFDSLLSRARGFNFDEILVMVGNDLFTYDYAYPYPHTEHGTPQEGDSRWQKLFREGTKLVIGCIDMLTQIAPVKVMTIPGNHDAQTTFYLGELLEVAYRRTKRVNVDNRARRRKYYQYHKNLIGASHGQKEKLQDWHAIMSAEEPKAWGETVYRYFYVAHGHHEKEILAKVKNRTRGSQAKTELDYNILEDYKGVVIDHMPSIAIKDEYEFKHGHVGTIAAMKSGVHHPDAGRIASYYYNNEAR